MHTSVWCSADAHLRQVKWIEGTGLKQVPDCACTASLLNRLLKRQTPPADPHQALPTPTAAVWESMHICLEMLLTTKRVFADVPYTPHITSLGSVDRVAEGLSTLQRDMVELPYNLVGGHLPASVLMSPNSCGELLCCETVLWEYCPLQVLDRTTLLVTLPCLAGLLT